MINPRQYDIIISKCKLLFKQEILPRISIDGALICQKNKDIFFSDYVSTHHLIELYHEFSLDVFSDLLQQAILWFKKNHCDIHNPFYLSTLAQTDSFESTNEKNIILEKILNRQKPSGLIDYFTGFTDGGLLFSTAWGLKSLITLNAENEYSIQISNAFEGVKKLWSDIDNNSLKGFFLELFLSCKREESNAILEEIISNYQYTNLWDSKFDLSLLYNSYIIGNLSLITDNKHVDEVVEDSIYQIFDLSNEVIEIPNRILEFKKTANDSNYVQTILRLIISINRYFKNHNLSEHFKNEILKEVINDYPIKNNQLVQNIGDLANWKKKYSEIDIKFAKHNNSIDAIWRESPFEKNIFLIMPFEDNEEYKALTETIRKKSSNYNLKVIRVDDSDKQFYPQMWDNLLVNMLSAKYAIAIYVDKHARSLKDNEEIKFFQNPNVALEYGFFTSRGLDIFLLKDINSKLPSDLQGFIYYEFDIQAPDNTIPQELDLWFQKISERPNDKN